MADSTVSYKCPACGAPLTFPPGADHVNCEFCGSPYSIKDIEAMFAEKEAKAKEAADKVQAKFDSDEAGEKWSEEEKQMFKTLVCSSCGAEIVADENTMATECCYCGNPTMVPQRFSGDLKPDFIIPFKKTKEEAVAALKEFYKGKKLLPDAFTQNNRVEDIQGLYVPFWLFDSDVHAEAHLTGTKRHSYSSGNEDITETEYYKCYRAGNLSFARVPADGSKRMDDAYMESIEPFNYDEMVPFSTAYLTGLLADKYDVTAEDNEDRIKARIGTTTTAEIYGTMGEYDGHDLDDMDITTTGGCVKYAMVPVWILSTRYEGQVYTFMMNGQTGKFIGRLPCDPGKERKYMIIGLVVALIVAFIALNLASYALYGVSFISVIMGAAMGTTNNGAKKKKKTEAEGVDV